MAAFALVVEDGSKVSGANSYVSLAEIKLFTAQRNIDLSAFSSIQLIGFAIRAMDFLESYRDRFKGEKATAGQSLQWPRIVNIVDTFIWSEWMPNIPDNVQIDGFDVLESQIPVELKNAQCQCIMELCNGVSLLPSSSPNSPLKMLKIGPITKEYFSNDTAPLLPAVNIFLDPLLQTTGGDFLKTVRV